MREAPTANLYLHAFYWAMTTLTTLGYGDINAVTKSEMGFATAIIFVGTCMFGEQLFVCALLHACVPSGSFIIADCTLRSLNRLHDWNRVQHHGWRR
jgi:hypothetical protein